MTRVSERPGWHISIVFHGRDGHINRGRRVCRFLASHVYVENLTSVKE